MKIREATLLDAKAILSIYSYYITDTVYSFEYTVPSILEFEKRIEGIKKTYPYLVACDNNIVVGYAYASIAFNERSACKWNCDVSVYVKDGYKKMGVGLNLYKRLEEILLSLGYVNIYALVTEENNVSHSFHKSLGYRVAARVEKTGYKFNKWHDLVFYHKQLCSLNNPNDFPKSVTKFKIEEIEF